MPELLHFISRIPSGKPGFIVGDSGESEGVCRSGSSGYYKPLIGPSIAPVGEAIETQNLPATTTGLPVFFLIFPDETIGQEG